MARNAKQIQVRLGRVELANRLLKWLKERKQFEGSHTHETVIIPFAKIEKADDWEVWKAWDILKESGRRLGHPGGHFSILSPDPIKADQFGNIIALRD